MVAFSVGIVILVVISWHCRCNACVRNIAKELVTVRHKANLLIVCICSGIY